MDRKEFEAMMSAVDRELGELGRPIGARQVDSVREFAKQLKCELPLSTCHRELRKVEGIYHGESLSAHILHWVSERYGDRLKTFEPWMGVTAVEIENDTWEMRVPCLIGKAIYPYWANDLLSVSAGQISNILRGDRLNVLDTIPHLTQSLANEFSDVEGNRILETFRRAYIAFKALRFDLKDEPLANAIVADLASSAKRAVDSSLYAQSRYDSLQASEKALKLFLVRRGKSFPLTHSLSALAAQCYENGLAQLSDGTINKAQIDAGVRYEARVHRRTDVLAAHTAALEICFAVAGSEAG